MVNDISFIKKHYKPIQPSVSQVQNEIDYFEFKPDRKLQNYIHCYWQLKTRVPLQKDFIYRVVSDGCIDIFFDLADPCENFVMGFCRKFTSFPLGLEFNYFGIRFLPGCFPLLFGINALTVSNKDQPLQSVLPNVSKWITDNIRKNEELNHVMDKLNYLLSQPDHHCSHIPDNRFLNALEIIFRKKGNLETEADLDTGLSPRHLRRIFNFYIGTTPKAFSKVVRFQQILDLEIKTARKHHPRMYYDFGYYDQAHFIKDFKTFYGLTPGQAYS